MDPPDNDNFNAAPGSEDLAPFLEPINEPLEEQFVLRGRSVWKIGRALQNDIVLNDRLVSRTHAIIQRTEGDKYLIIDLGSRNGALINGRRVSLPTKLSEGDRITIGKQEFHFRNPYASASSESQKLVAVPGEDSTEVLLSLSLITVLVADIKDFTGLSQRLNEGILAQTVGTWIRKTGAILQQQGSWGQKYIGDSVMAVWIHERDVTPLPVMCSAFQALSEVSAVTQGLREEFDLPCTIEIGAGINTGLASLGNMGSREFADYTALGDAVNRAFRLEAASKELGVDFLVGEETFRHLPELTPRGLTCEQHQVRLKGYTGLSIVYELSFQELPRLLAAFKNDQPT